MNDQKENTQEMTIEAAFQALDAILADLETDQNGLEETFAKYQKGLEYVKFLKERIDGIEKKLIILENGEENVG
ncbi:MAG: exodeoxyribonuclease VII small subunit [Lachnospiraceae bacterium]|nr:exodeoxyribonuclease VII small subunit [Lachnospiraceae bacterium]